MISQSSSVANEFSDYVVICHTLSKDSLWGEAATVCFLNSLLHVFSGFQPYASVSTLPVLLLLTVFARFVVDYCENELKHSRFALLQSRSRVS